jgi:hypothetical protein
MIILIADIVHHTLAKITSSRAAMVFRGKTSIDSMFRSRTESPIEIRKLVAWLLAKDRFTCLTNIGEVSSKLPSCVMIVLTINFGVQVSVCSDYNCGSYSPDMFLYHMTDGNER